MFHNDTHNYIFIDRFLNVPNTVQDVNQNLACLVGNTATVSSLELIIDRS